MKKNYCSGLLSSLLLSGCSLLQTPQDRVVVRDFGIASAAFTAWGVSKWDWFQYAPTFKSEGWFGKDTHAAGADKAGHLYMSYLLSEGMLWDFKRNGVEQPERKAALAALAAMTLIEVGDATSSKYGFSHEDWIADAVGVGASWFLSVNPEWGNRIDLRVEYWPSPGFSGKYDAAADYSGMKHLIAIKGDGFETLRGTALEYLELQAGYYTRGFRSYDAGHYDTPERHLYIGIGPNLPRIFGKDTTPGTFFRYYQPPKTYLEVKNTF
ncbi:MAG: DUF2279 domain-containing protein [Thiothrix sp.]|nr:DUF2279 domain-containing protein [Thiothrix sp.]HPE61588.1 DUF2279 domain-containing protein [Thiolinea sp.]